MEIKEVIIVAAVTGALVSLIIKIVEKYFKNKKQ
jgi:hypothetical protein